MLCQDHPRPRQPVSSSLDGGPSFQCFDCQATALDPERKAEPRSQSRDRRNSAETLRPLVLYSIIYHRALELGRPSLESLFDLDLGEHGNEILLNVVDHYFRTRNVDLRTTKRSPEYISR